MAVTASFRADFSSFIEAVDKAQVHLADMGKGASAVQGKLDRMIDNFSGRKLIQEAALMTVAIEKTGGVSALTAQQLEQMGAKASDAVEKLKKLGYEVPPGIQRIADEARGAAEETLRLGDSAKTASGLAGQLEQAFRNPLEAAKKAALGAADALGTVGLAAAAAVTGAALLGAGLFKLATDAAKVGAELDDMADKTGLSVPALSRLQNAAKVVGADMNTLTDVVFKLEKGIGDNTDAFQEGLQKMGLSTDQLKAAGPDKYLELIAAGLNTIPDAADRAAAGTAVMGKGFKDVAATLKDLGEGFRLTADIDPWTAEQAAQAEEFDQQLASLEVHAKALATALGRDLIPTISTLVGWLKDGGSFTAEWVGKLSGITSAFKNVTNIWSTAAAAVDVLRGNTGKLPPELERLTRSAEEAAAKVKALRDAAFDAAHTPEKDVAGWKASASAVTLFGGAVLGAAADSKTLKAAEDSLTETVKASIGAREKQAAALKKGAEESKRLQDQFDEAMHKEANWAFAITTNTNLLLHSLHGLGAELPKTQWQQNAEALERWQQAAAHGADSASELVKNLQGLGAELPKTTIGLTFGQSIMDGLAKSLTSIPDTIANAFIGGGGLSGGLKAIAVKLGVEFGKDLNKGIKASVETGGSGANSLTGKFAAASGAVTGLGAALSGASGKAAVASAAMAGVTVAAGAIGAGATIGGAVALGAATAGIGIAAVGAYYGLKKLLNDTEKKINPVREAFVQMAGGLQKLNERAHDAGITLDHLLNAKNPEQYQAAIDELTAAFDAMKAKIDADSTAVGLLLKSFGDLGGGKLPSGLQGAIQKLIDLGKITGDTASIFGALAGSTEVDFKKMQEVAGKYGIDLASLGQQFQSARLHASAAEIINDFDLLVRGGADVGGVLFGMRGDISKLVTASLKFGTDIPANMKPWILELQRAGLLVDDNGEKITDLSGLKFADPIKTEFQKIIDKLQELIDKISGSSGLTKAIDGIQKDVTVGVHFNVDNPEMPQFEPIQMATGGMGHVNGPTLFSSKGNEDFAFSGEGKSFGDMARGSTTSGDTTFNITMNGVNDADGFVDELRAAIRQNRRGIRTVLNEAVA